MIKRVKGFINNQKGLTLVELLAVIVILGIIAAIAVPSIGGLIDNTKKDAHLANAQQLISSAKLAVASNDDIVKIPATGSQNVELSALQGGSYLESGLKDPDGGVYSSGGVIIEETSGKKTYKVYLVGSKRSVGTLTSPVPSSALDDRTKVTDNAVKKN